MSGYNYGERANEFLTPDDARQFGHKCSNCNGAKVVYHVTIPACSPINGAVIPAGHYCLKCLAAFCKAAYMVPTPMADDLFDLLKAEIAGPGKRFVSCPL